MNIALSPLPDTLLGPDDDGYHGQLPARFRYLAPDAAYSLLRLLSDVHNRLVFTDMYRSPAGSRTAYSLKPGTQPPGYSAHGYGLAFDLDIGTTLRRSGLRFPELCDLLEHYGWFCHRRDYDSRGPDAWHFNFLGTVNPHHLLDLSSHAMRLSWSRPVEAAIVERWGPDFKLSDVQIAAALPRANALDVMTFQKEWNLQIDGVAGPITQRTLAFVTAAITIIPPVPAP